MLNLPYKKGKLMKKNWKTRKFDDVRYYSLWGKLKYKFNLYWLESDSLFWYGLNVGVWSLLLVLMLVKLFIVVTN